MVSKLPIVWTQAFDSVTGVFYSVIDDWSGQSRVVGINSTDGDVITNKTLSEPVQDIFVSELPYIMRLDPWAGQASGETLINVSNVNLYSTDKVDCHFSSLGRDGENYSTYVPASFDTFTRTAACVSPDRANVPGDIDFQLRLRGPTDADAEGERVTNSVAFSFYRQEQVYRIHPAFGPRFGGTVVTVEGSFFFGAGTVNELYCIFNGVRTIATYRSEHTATCTSPPEALFTHQLRESAFQVQLIGHL